MDTPIVWDSLMDTPIVWESAFKEGGQTLAKVFSAEEEEYLITGEDGVKDTDVIIKYFQIELPKTKTLQGGKLMLAPNIMFKEPTDIIHCYIASATADLKNTRPFQWFPCCMVYAHGVPDAGPLDVLNDRSSQTYGTFVLPLPRKHFMYQPCYLRLYFDRTGPLIRDQIADVLSNHCNDEQMAELAKQIGQQWVFAPSLHGTDGDDGGGGGSCGTVGSDDGSGGSTVSTAMCSMEGTSSKRKAEHDDSTSAKRATTRGGAALSTSAARAATQLADELGATKAAAVTELMHKLLGSNARK